MYFLARSCTAALRNSEAVASFQSCNTTPRKTSKSAGFGGVISFELEADLEKTGRFIDHLKIPFLSLSLGGVESLVGQVALTSYYEFSPEERAAIGISDSLVRLAVGIEASDDLLADLAQALDKTFQTETLFHAENAAGSVGPVVMLRR